MNGKTSIENELSVVHSRITESLEGPIRKTKKKRPNWILQGYSRKALAENDKIVIANKTEKPR